MDAQAPEAARNAAPLAPFQGAYPPAPAWFTEAIAREPERRILPVAGAGIETLLWGEVGRPGLLLLHGNAAHAGWWRFIAPYFADTHRVAAFSWSGMGGSDWRRAYTLDGFVAEIMEVSGATGLFAGVAKPFCVAHSFGSWPLAEAAHRHGERFAGVVLVESPISTPERREARRRKRGDAPRPPRSRPHNIYPSLEAALARFRLMPPQDCDNLHIVDHIARESLKRVADGNGGDGYTWRFDPFLWRELKIPDLRGALGHLRCPAALMRGGLSRLMEAEDAAYTLSLMPPGTPLIEIPEAWHHVMLDQPLAFVAALRALIARWGA